MPRSLLALLLVLAAGAALPASASALVQFRSPTGNIGCIMDRKQVRCDIRVKEWMTERPRMCEFEYGQGLYVGRRDRSGGIVCAGDTAINEGRKLAYGDSIRRGKLRCVSRESGMVCRNRRGAGFRIARDDYDIYRG